MYQHNTHMQPGIVHCTAEIKKATPIAITKKNKNLKQKNH